MKVVQVAADVAMQTSYDVAPELAPQVSVAFLFTFVAPFDGELFENAPGSCDAGRVENVRHVLPSAARRPGRVRRLHLPVVLRALRRGR